MQKVILIIGVVLVVWGFLIVLRPEFIRKAVHLLSKGPLVYMPAAVRVLLGVVFLVAARDCQVRWLIIALGVIMFTAGVIMFMIKPSKLRPMFQWWVARSPLFLHIMGLVAAGIGGLIAWAA